MPSRAMRPSQCVQTRGGWPGAFACAARALRRTTKPSLPLLFAADGRETGNGAALGSRAVELPMVELLDAGSKGELRMLRVVGIGPGDADQMTPRALAALRESSVIVGYSAYVELVRPLYPEKEFVATAMRGEEERCRMAVGRAAAGEEVSVICSGDAGVYGMAGLVLTLAARERVDVEVVPGMTAACTGAALLGAPLTHDFAVISLSDLLTPWERIEQRLRCAAEADFVLCLYNPMSRRRTGYLRRACEIAMQFRSPETPCGLARNIGRDGESGEILTLEMLRDANVDMFTTVFIGNSQTRVIGGRMVTPRGYRAEREEG